MKKGQLIISLDFELMWGVRDKRTIENYGENVRGVRQVIPSLLHLFEQYHINATFATVGFLFARDKEELLQYRPAVLPEYDKKNYSAYENNYFDRVGSSEKEDIFHFAASLIRMIQQHPQHEIASHTFSHFYCLENASLLSFEHDLMAAKKIAGNYGIELKTIVFPRNQYSSKHIDVCKKLGFIAYRGNQSSFIYKPRKNEDINLLIRGARLTDAYINLTGHHSFDPIQNKTMVNIPASCFLRPYSGNLKWADGLRLKRIKNSMLYAARNQKAYHLWWHPHNFGINLKENLSFLEEILKYYQHLHQQFGMESKTMKTIAEEILKPHAV